MSSAVAHRIGVPRRTRATPFQLALRASARWLRARVEAWRRRSRDRAVLSRMNIRQLDDLPIEWPEDLRHIRRS